ncbi:MAG: FAD:protein FMN transferase [Desulfosudaceae bacterium]
MRTSTTSFYPRIIPVLLLLMLAAGSGCGLTRSIRLTGQTMGTVYHITIIAPLFTSADNLQKKVDRRLEEINQHLSTHISTSEISRFNEITDTGEPFSPSADLATMIHLGQRLYRLTDGAWDGTIRPLVRLWGFDEPGQPPARLPEPEAVASALKCVGFQHIQVLPSGEIAKEIPCLVLDFASIAKGYGADQLAALLKAEGLENFLVEIGGEVVTAGTRKDGRAWQVGINIPDPAAPANQVRQALPLSDKAVATSGDYRNFFIRDGIVYCHVIDPQTGYPVSTGVVSATVTAGTCALADGLATAMMVMGVNEGLALVDSLAGVECLLTVRRPDGSYDDFYSNQFRRQGETHE